MHKIIYLKAKPQTRVIPIKYLSISLMALGFLLITLALWPIVSFNMMIASRFTSIVKPVPDISLIAAMPKKGFTGFGFMQTEENIVEAKDNEKTTAEIDYTKASVWFPKKTGIVISEQNNVSYTISIPKLKIQDALVLVGSDELSKSLIQYAGTGYPGDYGNAVVFGHSVLPYFFNPKDYHTIFSTLPTLSEGDEILVNFEGITYHYVIEEMRVVNPDDVEILEQKYDDAYLSLITCVPPGTYEKRLWVKARLKKI